MKNEVKKAYSAPRLTMYGTISEMTKNLAKGPSDGVSGKNAQSVS